MAETKFTPGPWTTERCSDALEIGAETQRGHLSVAWIHGFNPGDDTAATWADGWLIAAAPDLYASLAEIVEEWGCPNTPKWHRARAALAKARGEKG